jgi:hypothetical protein
VRQAGGGHGGQSSPTAHAVIGARPSGDDDLDAGLADPVPLVGVRGGVRDERVHLVLPLAKPALATLAIFTLLGAWNDLVWPLIAINSETVFTIQLGLANFQSTRHTQWSLLMAGNVVATAPLIAFFLAAQRQFIATMTLSGMKG